MNIQDAAQKVLDEHNVLAAKNSEAQEVFFDPGSLFVIASLLSILFNSIRLYCYLKDRSKAGKDIKTSLTNNPIGSRLQVRRAVKQALSPEEFRQKGRQLINSVLVAGQKADPNDLQCLFEATPNEEI